MNTDTTPDEMSEVMVPEPSPSSPETVEKTAADVLERAADLIAKPGAWTQGAYARNASGEPTGTNDYDAVCFCAAGAIGVASPESASLRLIYTARRHFRESVRSSSIADWNDTPGRTQAEVVAKLREAAALARAEASR